MGDEVVMNRGTCFPGHLMQSSIRILFAGQLHEMVKKGAYENMDQIEGNLCHIHPHGHF